MTKAAKIWSMIIISIFVGILVVVGVGIFMASTLNKLQDQQKTQTDILKRLDESDVEAESDRKILLDSDRNVQAVVDCIIKKTNDFPGCVNDRREELIKIYEKKGKTK